ncbi:MAG: phospholipase A [Halomonas sp.]|nr:phospholipase A [Halomonas sp.]
MVIRHRRLTRFFVLCGLTAVSALTHADTREDIEARISELNNELSQLHQQLEQAESLEESGDVGERIIQPPEVVALDDLNERRQFEQESSRNPFSITTHPADSRSDNNELKFQFSAKVNLAEDVLWGDYGDLYFGYTQRSWWQAYNTDDSSPFRETNYEPEVFIDIDTPWEALGWVNTRNRVALNHQSNGRSDPFSRSWNRVYLESIFQSGDWAVTFAPHWRIPESDDDDDNPDIERFMGYGDIRVAKRLDDNHEVSGQLRGNPSAGNMGTQIDYSWPAFNSLRAHVQYYYGYGESLIDYDHRVHRLSIGFSLNPLFSASGLNR